MCVDDRTIAVGFNSIQNVLYPYIPSVYPNILNCIINKYTLDALDKCG